MPNSNPAVSRALRFLQRPRIMSRLFSRFSEGGNSIIVPRKALRRCSARSTDGANRMSTISGAYCRRRRAVLLKKEGRLLVGSVSWGEIARKAALFREHGLEGRVGNPPRVSWHSRIQNVNSKPLTGLSASGQDFTL